MNIDKKFLSDESLDYAAKVAYNLEPVFQHYKWVYSWVTDSNLMTAEDIELNIISLMHAAAEDAGVGLSLSKKVARCGRGCAESGRIRVEYDDSFAQPFTCYLGSLDLLTREE